MRRMFVALVFLWAFLGSEAYGQSLYVLVDVSGSMQPYVKELEIVLPVVVKAFDFVRVFAFSDTVREVKPSQLPRITSFIGGGTRLSLAFDKLLPFHPEGLILLTDGLPDNPALAAQKVKLSPNTLICSIYFGTDRRGYEFLKKISSTVIKSQNVRGSLKRCFQKMEEAGLLGEGIINLDEVFPEEVQERGEGVGSLY